MQSEKKKLTLSINSEVIEKAKKLGLNLSEITEKALKISSLSPDDNIVTPDKLREVYIDVLKKISEILKKWNARLEIGSQDDLAV
ncbi:MAG: type II toxin-antitoxin system CcdA family antitoxin [Candidatus Methanoperedens sp.]|nr:type II toxin-antitoxin system CcdA family antitoxin [Candidatus Methanoperedens sp.]